MSAQVTLDLVQTFGDEIDAKDFIYAVASDADGNIYSAGEFSGTVDFDAGAGVYELTCIGGGDGFILKTDSSGNFIWAVRIGSTNGDNAYSIKVNTDGSVYTGGWFTGDVDFDPGPGTFFLHSITQISYILKLDADGNFIWAVQNSCVLWDIDIDSEGNVVSTGSYSGGVDFDPGPAVHSLGGSGTNAFIQKLDADGNYVWATGVGSPEIESASSITVDNDDNVIIHGQFWGTVDFDPGAGVFNLTSNGYSDLFVMKVDEEGNFLWAVSYGGASSEEGSSLALGTDEEGNIIVGGTFWGTVDFDPGPGIENKSAGLNFNGYLLKLDAEGSFVWIRTNTGEYMELVNLELDDMGNVYATGHFRFSADFDPGPAIFTLHWHEGSQPEDTFIQKLDNDGNFIWAIDIGGDGLEQGRCITLDSAGYIIAGGAFTFTCDFDPGSQLQEITAGGTLGYYDAYVARLRETDCADLTIVIDSISNPECSISGFAAAHAVNGIAPYLYQWITEPIIEDSIAFFTTEGYYSLTVTDSAACAKTTTILLTGPSTATGTDMTANLIYPGFAPGFPTTITVDAFNDGCEPAAGIVELTLDKLLTFTGSDPEPDIIDGKTLVWNIDYAIFDSLHRTFDVHVTTSEDATLEDFVDLNVRVTTTATDIDTTNDVKDYHDQVIGSYDPNDKQVYPAGACEEGYISHEQLLTYTIRFQNTGTAEAHNIYILDTLNNRLDKNTVRVIAASHTMHTEYLEGNVLRFAFDNIYLPDSTTNESESHGYVIYEISTKPSASNGSVIENGAAIYFDFNDPVITNTVSNTLTDEVPETDTAFQHLDICAGDVVTVAGHPYSENGIYTDFLRSADGCDSLIISTVNIFYPADTAYTDTICEGDEIVFGGELLDLAGLYTYTGETMYGCDSIVTLDLHVLPATNTLIENFICDGNSVIVGDSIYAVTGEYVNIFPSSTGCDSTVTLDLVVLDAAYTHLDKTICAGEIYIFGAIEIFEAGVYTQTFSSAAGCDSIVELNVSVQEINTEVTVSGSELQVEDEGANYQWLDCSDDFSIIDGATGPSYIPAIEGEYAVEVTAGDCIDTSACYYFLPLDVKDKDHQLGITVYPNPSSGEINIVCNTMLTHATFQILNMQGSMVMQNVDMGTNPLVINIKDLSSGFYLIELVDETYSGRAIVVKN